MGIHQKSATIDIAQVKELSKLEGEFLARKEARDKELANIIKGEDERLLLVIGPCSSQLEASRKRDLFKKNTGVGPHRDDLAFFINELNASFGSQGQQRSLILSLKLAEIDLIKASTKESPILLLDDVMSELDYTRQEKLLQAIKDNNVQTFMTTTSIDHFKDLPQELKLFTIEAGHLLDEKE